MMAIANFELRIETMTDQLRIVDLEILNSIWQFAIRNWLAYLFCNSKSAIRN
jgi:hypothetical protein